MDEAMAEALVTEHTRLEQRLTDPAVLRDHLRARRMRRAMATLESLLDDLQDGEATEWDRYDPFDVILTIEAEPEDVDLLWRRYRDLAARRPEGWRAVPLDGEPRGRRRAVLAITAGETGPGAWSVLKADNGVHLLNAHEDADRAARPDARPARVTVLPHADEAVALPGSEQDWRIDLLCTRSPEPPSSITVTHLPSGARFHGEAATSREAHANALRQALARALADSITADEPAYRHLRPRDEPKRHPKPIAPA
jgi:protein subunit release factor A